MPGDAEGFLAYAGSMRTQTIYNAIRPAKRLGGVARYGFPESVGAISSALTSFLAGFCPSPTQSASSIPSTVKA
jgi:hypothetical protein